MAKKKPLELEDVLHEVEMNREKLRQNQYLSEIISIVSENTNDAYLLFSTQDFKAEYVSPNLERLTGITPTQVYEEGMDAIRPEGWEKEDSRGAVLDIEPGQSVVFERKRKHKVTGEERLFTDTFHIAMLGERPKALLIVSDVTEEKRAKEALKEALENANRANKAKSEFLSNMSHDIRTPMNVIIGFNSLAQKNIDDKEKVLDSLKKVESASHHLLNLINDVLEMSRIENGRFALNEENIVIQDLIDEVDNMFRTSMEEKGIRFIVNADHVHTQVCTDGTRLKQLLTNLLGNAQKFTETGGTVWYTSRELGMSGDEYAEYEIRVKDTGIGMSKEFQKRMYQTFTREKNTTNSGVVGTGLGLSIAKEIANLLGGTITCFSEQGTGTEFVFRFKAKIISENVTLECKKISPLDANADLVGKRLLVVEDNELNLEIAVELLKEYGFVLETANDGDVAVDKLKHSSPGYYDLVLMDIQMPKMNGYIATREIRKLEDEKVANVPILAMTANAFEEDKKKALDVGMNGHLSKPIVMEEVIDNIKKLLLEC